MLGLLRTIFCIFCLLLFLALAISWPLARSKPVGLWYKSTKTNLFGEFINSSDHYFITVQGNQIHVGHWRDPRLVALIKDGLTQDRILPPQAQIDAMVRLGIAFRQPTIHRNFSDPALFFLPYGLHTGPQ